MPLTCTPAALADSARCYVDINAKMRKAMRVANLCLLVNGDPPVTDIEDQIEQAKCYAYSLSWAQLDAAETYLICQLSP